MSGDVVLVQDTNEVRGKWKMALVRAPLISQDGMVRRVKIKYRTEAGTDQEVERPVQRLILLAAADDSPVGDADVGSARAADDSSSCAADDSSSHAADDSSARAVDDSSVGAECSVASPMFHPQN